MKAELKGIKEFKEYVLLLLEKRKVISDGERGRMWSDYWDSSLE